ncbi:MAG: Rrf2 family transcriptional regulator [Bacteroidia bacterium]|nr:Rrf2 family transcriptional regulator [Bacteroidia bacterium]
MLSVTCQVALKAVTYIASKYEKRNKKSGIKEIAMQIEESEHTIGKVLQKLVALKIISSTKGPNGGFFISKEQHQHPIILIVKAVEGQDFFDNCGLGLGMCSDTHPCPIHEEFKPVREAFKEFSLHKKIGDLYPDLNDGKTYLVS